MKLIGRKIYLNWGKKHIIAIEKYPFKEELVKQFNFDEDNKISIFNIYDCLGQKIENYVGRPNNNHKMLGYEIGEYVTTDSFWCTNEEAKQMCIDALKDERQSLEFLKKQYSFEPGDFVPDNDYKEIDFLIRIHAEDESFWGKLFRNEDILTYKNVEIGKKVYFIAANTTLAGHICGKVYIGTINNYGKVEG